LFGHAPLMRFTRQDHLSAGSASAGAPPLFDQPDGRVAAHLGPDQRHRVVCIKCWRRLTEVIDGGTYQAEHGGPQTFATGYSICH
jgi:hypothetical protein